MKIDFQSFSRQRGVTLLEMILVMALLAVATLIAFESRQAELEQSQARAVGLKISQYNNAVRSLIVKTPSLASGQKVGSAWLKSTECGGPFPKGSEFLPCDFPAASVADPIKYGLLSINSTIDVTGTSSDRRVTVTTLTTPYTIMESTQRKVRSDLSGVAAITAASATDTGFSASGSYNSNPVDGRITMVASNKPDNDVWLRTDGGNKMHASLGFDGANAADRQILGASRIQNLAGQVLRIGSGSALSPVTSSSVVIDSSTEVLGDVKVRQSLVVDSSAAVAGNVTAGGAVIGQVFYDANNTGYYLDPHSTSNLNAVNAQGSITANGNIRAAGTVRGQVFYDENNTGYYVDPNNTSNINSLSAQGNASVAGSVTTQIMYDANNTGYYVDPHATSNVNAVNAGYLTSNGRMTANEYLRLGGIAYVGYGCAPNGLIASSAVGEILSCKSGVWTSAGGASLGTAVTGGMVSYHDSSNDGDAYCPEGSVLVGLLNRKNVDSYYLACRWLN
jgi:prepilin-type N-terminal cleavage/methylation domain-containing protein